MGQQRFPPELPQLSSREQSSLFGGSIFRSTSIVSVEKIVSCVGVAATVFLLQSVLSVQFLQAFEWWSPVLDGNGGEWCCTFPLCSCLRDDESGSVEGC